MTAGQASCNEGPARRVSFSELLGCGPARRECCGRLTGGESVCAAMTRFGVASVGD
jgi:hypothetical protein